MTRNLATVLCWLGVTLLTHCTSVEAGMGGGGTGGMPNTTDCDPVAQTGCNPGEKCTQVELTPPPEPQWETRCVTAGSQSKFDTCIYQEDTGFDDCEAGLICVAGACREICSADPDSCSPADERCQPIGDLFEDRPGTGVCFVQCDPLGQDCPEDVSCFVTSESGHRVCAEPNPGNDQGATCEFANDCSAGHGCLLIRNEIDPTLTCAFFCDPEGGSPTCAEGPGATFRCDRIVDFYVNADFIGSDLGFCVDPTIFPPAL